MSFDKSNGETKVIVMSADGGELQEFPNPIKNKVPLAIHDLLWLSDGCGLSLFDYNREGKEQALCQRDLKTNKWKEWPISVQSWTRAKRKLDLGFPEGTTFLCPSWSPDGKQIAFMA